MTDAVTNALREAILQGVLRPGSWLREGDLAEALSVSRTPIREALKRLSDEGVTERIPNRGTVVASLSVEDILAIYEVRATLEGLAARLAARHQTPDMVAALRATNEKMRWAAASGADLSAINMLFHRRLREAAGSDYLARFLIQIENDVRRFGQTTLVAPGRDTEVIAEHESLIDAIENGEAERAEELAVAHIRKARAIRITQLVE